MNRSRAFRLALAAALIAVPAWAVKTGDTLYIKNKGTKILKTATATGAMVVTLQPGAEVIWQSVDAKDKQFHKVKSGAKEGFVLFTNLTPVKVQAEVTSDGKSIDGRALAASGAATRALSASGQKQAAKSPDFKTAAQQVVLLEGINHSIKEKDVEEHATKQGLNKVGK